MPVVVVTPPIEVVTLAEAKTHMRVDWDEDDATIQGMIDAVVQKLDAVEGFLGRALGAQTLELQAAHFPGCCWPDHDLFEPCFATCSFYDGAITLPFRPIVSMTSVKYVDQAGTLQTVDPSLYSLSGGRLSPAYGAGWPNARFYPGAVQIRYIAGYPDGIPAPIRSAILMMVAAMFDMRADAPEIKGAAAALLSNFQVTT